MTRETLKGMETGQARDEEGGRERAADWAGDWQGAGKGGERASRGAEGRRVIHAVS